MIAAARGGGAHYSGHSLASCRPNNPGCARASGRVPRSHSLHRNAQQYGRDGRTMEGSRTIMAISVMGIIVLLCVVCTFVDGNRRPMETPDNSENQVACDSPGVMGFVTECINVPEDVLSAAKTQVERLFDIGRTDYPDHSYTSWRIADLSYAYTYDDLGGMRLAIYQMNYEFLTESPDSVVLAGGMYITEDNWVMPGYPNSTYLIFRQDGDKLRYLQSIVENDCAPGTQLFTDDLQEILARY